MNNLSTFYLPQEGSSKSLHLDLNKDDTQVVIASTSVFRIYDIEDDNFRERYNLRGSKSQNLNYSSIDVCWNNFDPNLLATAATNGAVVLWNLARSNRNKQEHVFNEHKRTVNKVVFHPVEFPYLLSGSQDGSINLYDIRTHEVSSVFQTQTNVRDVAFCPHGHGHLFAAGLENGQIQLWDVRRPDKFEKKWPAHSDHIFAVDWHPESKYTLASAGRDKQIKVWNSSDARSEHVIYSIGPVGRVKWRPRFNYHLASCSGLVGDFSINVWDVRRSHVPFAVLNEHRNTPTDLKWTQDPDRLLSGGKDNLIHHAFKNAHRPANKAPPAGLSFNNSGHLSFAYRDGTVVTASSTSTLAVLPEVMPKLAVSSLTPTESSTSYRMASFLRPPPAPKEEKKDLFLTFNSQLKEFVMPDFSVVNNADFVTQAENYVLSGLPVEVLCEINAQVSESAGRYQLAETWRGLRTFVRDPLDWSDEFDDNIPPLPMVSELVSSNPRQLQNTDHAANVAEGTESDERSVRSRTMTDSNSQVNGRTVRRESSVTTSGGDRRNTRGKNASTESGRFADGEQQGDDHQDDDDYEMENEMTLTGIASGQMLFGAFVSDFFGDNEIGSGDIQLEPLVTSDLGRNEPDLSMQNEAFQPRIKLNAHGAYRHQNNEDNDFANGESETNSGNQINGNADADGVNAQARVSNQTVVVEDQTSGLVVADWAIQIPIFSPLETIRNTLMKWADTGDVQTAVSMLLVLRNKPEYKHLIEDATIEYWFTCYIEMLQRFKLYNVANAMTKKCPVPSISTMNQRSTTYLTNCTRCNKALSRPQGSWWCERCKRTPNLCSICQDIVRGLFSWCQGCAHGGHLKCLKRWYSRNTICPTGCGHHCEYQ